MAQSITLTVGDDAQANYLFDGIALKWGYETMVDDPPVPNPESKKEFITRVTGEFWKTEAIQGYMKGHEETEQGSINSIVIVGT